jgi:hypothetical protein
MAEIRGFGDNSYLSIHADKSSNVMMTIHDIRGMQLYSNRFFIHAGEFNEIELPHFASGMYIVSIRTENGVQALRFVR